MKTNRRQFVKLAILFCAALFCVAGSAPSLQVAGTARVGTLSRPAGAAASYLLEENFEAPGYENSWTEVLNSGTITENDTTPSMEGTYSVYGSAGSPLSYTHSSLSGADVFYGYFQVNFTTISDFTAIFTLSRVGVADEFRVTAAAASGFGVYNGTVSAGPAGGALSTGTTYHVWVEYQKGTGANGIGRVWHSTTSTKPGTPTISVTNGDSTSQPTAVSIQWWPSPTAEHNIDRVLIDDEEIGSSP